jgi:hypothetical protein
VARSGSSTSSSRHRVVHFHLGPLHGHTVTIAEEARGIEHPLGSAHTGTNAINFTIADGPAGRRKVVALIANDTGVATTKRTIATFIAPGPVRPGRPRVKVRRSGTKLVVSWPRLHGSTRYRELVKLSDGRMLQFVGKHPTLSVPGVAPTASGKISVTAQDGALLGPAGTATLHAVKKKAAKKRARRR